MPNKYYEISYMTKSGYDFYEAHWIPLYEARGLKWHKESEEI